MPLKGEVRLKKWAARKREKDRALRLPNPTTLVQRLDRVLDWQTTIDAVPPRAMRPRASPSRSWLDQQEQLAGLGDPQVL